MTHSITVTVNYTEDNLFQDDETVETINVPASMKEFEKQVESEIKALYPEADIDFRQNIGGTDIDTDDQVAEDTIRQTVEDVYKAFNWVIEK